MVVPNATREWTVSAFHVPVGMPVLFCSIVLIWCASLRDQILIAQASYH